MRYGWCRTIALSAGLALMAALGLFAGCGSGTPSGDGTLSVLLADAPDPSVTAVNVTLDRVEVNTDGGWEPLATEPQTFNLLDLAQTAAPIGSITLPPGQYSQIRLFASNVTLEDETGIHPVTVPSGDQTGIKINVNCEVRPNEVCAVLLDFNVPRSIVQLGNGEYHLQPVIPAVVQVLSGTITGKVVQGTNNKPVKGATVAAMDAAGAEANSTMTLNDGTFKIWALMPGTYTLQITLRSRSLSVPGVEVRSNQDTAVGNLKLP